ncbi:MAG: putative Histidine kinase, partial [Nitrospira sp.]|nr:putative Histidine kinase [Nitrospira sp.]
MILQSTTQTNAPLASDEPSTRYRELVHGLPVAIYCTDEKGLITMYNEAAAELWGRRPALGTDVWCGSYRIFRPDLTELPFSQCPLAVVVQTGTTTPPQEIIVERPDGSRRHVLAHPQLLVDAEKRSIGAFNLLVDISDQKQAESARAHLAAIVTSSDDAIISKDLNGVITSWNVGAQRLFGYSSEEMVGRSILHLIPADRQHEERMLLDRIRSGERVHHYETIRRRKDGRLIDISISLSPVRNGRGHIIGASKIARDITQEKRRRTQQHHLHELATHVNRAESLPTLYEKALDAIMRSLSADRASILLSDMEGVMRFKAWRGLSDRYRAAVEGHSPWKPDDPAPAPILISDISGWEGDGQLKDLIGSEGIGSLAFIPLTYGGRVLGKFMVYFDRPHAMEMEEVELAQALAQTLALGIERKAAEDCLRESESQLRLALEAGRMGSWEWNILTNHVGWSTGLEAIHGLAPGTFDGTFEGYQQDIHPEDRERVLRAISQTLEGDEPYQIEYRIIRPDGAIQWVEGKGKLYRAPAGSPTRMIGVCTDITERKQAEQALRESEDKLRRLAGQLEQLVVERTAGLRALATELNLTEQRERQRLATELHDHLQQLLVLSKLKLGQGKRLAESLPSCVELMKQTDEVLSQALTYTRTLVAELSPPILKEFGLSAALTWLAEQMRQHQLTVLVQALSDEPKVPEEHAVLLFQSVRELLINSAKYAGTGVATVSVRRESSALCVEVRDEGKGFDTTGAWHQEATASSSKFGLFSIRERMKALGGMFELQSSPDKGTNAKLVLPLTSNDSGEAPPVEATSKKVEEEVRVAPPPQRPPDTVIRVLLVDDHAMMRQGLRSVLEAYADVHIVGEARDGEEAIASVRHHEPSIVVMDINMPNMNGIDATIRIKASYPEIKVIGLSVNADESNQRAMKQAGADLLLTKEAAVDELYRAIQQSLA